ncbi:MAG: FecR domain-containing protein [Pseudomonadota bacterium]
MMHYPSDPQQQAHLWRTRIDAGLSDKEEHEFQQWMAADQRNSAEFAKAEIGWGLLGELALPSAASMQQEHSPVPTTSIGEMIAGLWDRLGGNVFAGAATVAALIAVAFLSGIPAQFVNPPQDTVEQFATALGQKKLITLADGSRVTLGAASEIQLVMGEDERRVTLVNGNAYFEVEADAARPFYVDSDIGKVMVTGTTFDVQLREDSFSVAVGEGTVDVALAQPGPDNGQNLLSLAAGQAVRADRQGFGEITEVFPAELAAWRLGRLIYLQTPLSEVAADINRYSKNPVEVRGAARDITISGIFDAANVETMLATIDSQLPVRIERDGENRVIMAE